MFQYKLFTLSTVAFQSPVSIVNDCNFAFVGKIGSRVAPRLVAATSSSHLRCALADNGIAGAIISQDLYQQEKHTLPLKFGIAIAGAPVNALNLIQRMLASDGSGQWTTFQSKIHNSVHICEGAYVSPTDVIIGRDCVISHGAVILPRTIIGERTTIGSGTIVGTDAFEVDSTQVPHVIVKQSGGVSIGNDVDILAKCTIVRATFGGFTEIGDQSKIDCQVHVAHDCRILERVKIAACAELSGRVTVEQGAFIGPNSTITNGCVIGAGAHVTLGAVVTRDVDEGTTVSGNFALPHRQWLNLMRKLR